LNDSPVVLRNNGTKNHWLGLQLVGTKSNRSAIGARVIVNDATNRKRIFDVSTAGSDLASNDPRILVGLGTATSVRSIEIRWPSKQVQTIDSPAIDRYHTIIEK
jgi:hypothetical protein